MGNNPVRCGLLVAAALVGLLLGGCAGSAEPEQEAVSQMPKALAAAATPVDDAPDVRIISLDFDPPLNSDGSLPSFDKRTLFVAVDNQGKKAESDVVVSLEIRGPDDKEPLLSQSQTVASLGCGEVKVLRFGGLAPLPVRSSYTLVVSANPVPGEINVGDNRKSLELHLSKS